MPDQEPNHTDQHPFYDILDEQQQRREFSFLLEWWLQAHQARPTVPGERSRFDVESIVADARAALERGSTPYITLLLIVAQQFLSPQDRELEMLTVSFELPGCVKLFQIG